MTDFYFKCPQENQMMLASKIDISKDLGEKIDEDGTVQNSWNTVFVCTCSGCNRVTEIRL